MAANHAIIVKNSKILSSHDPPHLAYDNPTVKTSPIRIYLCLNKTSSHRGTALFSILTHFISVQNNNVLTNFIGFMIDMRAHKPKSITISFWLEEHEN